MCNIMSFDASKLLYTFLLVADNSSFSVSAIGVLAAGAVIVPAGLVAAAGTWLSLTGAATSLVALIFEGINECRKLKTIQKQMEMLKEHIPAYVLYSDMTDCGVMSGLMTREATGGCKNIFTVIKDLYAMWTAPLASKASAEFLKVNKTLLFTSAFPRLMTLYNLFTERNNLYQDRPSKVIKHLRVLKCELEHIAQGCRC